MATQPDSVDETIDGVTFVELTAEQAWAEFEAEVRARLGIGAAEFIRRLDAGDYGDPDDDPTIMWLAFSFEGKRGFGFHLP